MSKKSRQYIYIYGQIRQHKNKVLRKLYKKLPAHKNKAAWHSKSDSEYFCSYLNYWTKEKCNCKTKPTDCLQTSISVGLSGSGDPEFPPHWTMEVETVTHALSQIGARCGWPQMPSSSQIQWVCDKWNGKLECVNGQHPQWVYYPGHARVKGNDWVNRLVGKATITDGLRLGRSEVLRSLRLPVATKTTSEGHHTINCQSEGKWLSK